jgi:hypothetical protein
MKIFYHKILGYTQWRNCYDIVIKCAVKAYEENRRGAADHFVRSYNMVSMDRDSQRKTEDVLLSRYIAYLVVRD